MLGGNGTTLAVANSFRPPEGAGDAASIVTAALVPLAWTPLGVAVGDRWQSVGIPLTGLFDWIDRTFPAEDARAFVTSIRDAELLVRVGWEAPLPERLDERCVLNIEDLPDEIADALALTPVPLVQCAACRRLCARDEFVWREKQLCAWDYHAQAFGKRGPWHNGAYETRHFETLPSCAYVAPPLLTELGVESVLELYGVAEPVAQSVLNTLLDADSERPHLAVRTRDGFTVLREV
ncbi:MAG: hypothetical protein WA814_13990 [Candidatus Baltobacteraceae bacterium]